MNLLAAQWQGSGYTNELYSGAKALGKYIGKFGVEFDEVEISGTGNLVIENDIVGYSVIKEQLARISESIIRKNPAKILTIGGGCGIEIPVISYFAEKSDDLKVIWFDAHGDLNTPEESNSKLFHGMPLRFLVDEIKNNEVSEKYMKIKKSNVVLLGTRDLDPAEITFINDNDIKKVTVEGYRQDENQLKNLKGTKVYVHLDLDVIDPDDYRNIKCPVKNGFLIEEVVKIIRKIQETNEIVGISILENIEENEQGLSKLDELIRLCIDVVL